MKKIVFSAIASIAFMGSAFASNEIINLPEITEGNISLNEIIVVNDKVHNNTEKDPCIINIYTTNSKGERILKSTHKIKTYPYSDCDEAIKAVNEHLSKIKKN